MKKRYFLLKSFLNIFNISLDSEMASEPLKLKETI
jgi:hypothetical protein